MKSAQEELEVSLVNLSERRQDYYCWRCTESKRLNTWGVVEGRTQRVCAKALKEPELTISGGIVPLRYHVGEPRRWFEEGSSRKEL